MKKLASLLLALVMIMSCFSAMATSVGNETNGSITVENIVEGQTYTAYKVFDVTYNVTAYAYSIAADSAWYDTVNAYEGITLEAITTDSTVYNVIKNDSFDAAAFAALLSADTTKSAPIAMTIEDGKATVNGLELGYYFVTSSLGSLCNLTTTNPAAEIYEKNAKPTLDKEVMEDSTSEWGDVNDADINQVVKFQATITVYGLAKSYVMHDTMSKGLTYNAVTSVTLNGTEVAAENYTVIAPGEDGCTFDVVFSDAFCATLKTNDKIVVSYNATLNKDAVAGNEGNPNEANLSYQDNNNTEHETQPDKTITYTWEMEVLKYANGDESMVLADAQFVLLNKAKDMVATIVDGKLTGWVAIPGANEDGTITWPENAVLTTDAAGQIAIEGLDADTYYLREIKAPAGYNILTEDKEVVITEATKQTAEDGTVTLINTVPVAKVNNQSGVELPETGGMGTTILYVGGGILVLAAIVLLIAKRRTAA